MSDTTEGSQEPEKKTWTVEELTDHVLAHRPAREVVMAFIGGSVAGYEKLRAAEGDDGNPLAIMCLAARDLGWNFILDSGDPEGDVVGLITGTDAYCDRQWAALGEKKGAVS